MLCQVCDNITLRALHSKYGYRHMPSFNALKASAEAELCSLCRLLWQAVELRMDSEQPADNSIMQCPVRLRLDGQIESFTTRNMKKIIKRRGSSANFFLYHMMMNSKGLAMIKICALKPDRVEEGRFMNWIQGRVSLYREPCMNQRLTVTEVRSYL